MALAHKEIEPRDWQGMMLAHKAAAPRGTILGPETTATLACAHGDGDGFGVDSYQVAADVAVTGGAEIATHAQCGGDGRPAHAVWKVLARDVHGRK